MPTDLEQLAHLLQAAETVLTRRVHLWRDVIDEEGRVLGSVYRGSFAAPPPPKEQESTT